MGESINLINNYKINNLIFNCGTYNFLEKELIKELENKKIKNYTCIKELILIRVNYNFYKQNNMIMKMIIVM